MNKIKWYLMYKMCFIILCFFAGFTVSGLLINIIYSGPLFDLSIFIGIVIIIILLILILISREKCREMLAWVY